ncbi:hypothetical protein LC574_24120 [Nostoc sp. CHAB 5715]|nr:hypothetical protein [Nostoc sp. CHAB 5715]
MTSAISKELQFLAGHGFYVKLTRMSNALPLRQMWFKYMKTAVRTMRSPK